MKQKEHGQYLKDIKEITEKLYTLNSAISGSFVSKLFKPTDRDMLLINKTLSEQIKRLRELIEKWERQQ